MQAPDKWKAFRCLHKGQEGGSERGRVWKMRYENRTLEELLWVAIVRGYPKSWLGIGVPPLEKARYWGLSWTQRESPLISCVRNYFSASAPIFSPFSGILIFISLDGYSVTQIVCAGLGAENFRGSRLHALQKEHSKTRYFQQASSLSSDCCPSHMATCLHIWLQLLPGRVSANCAVVTSISWQQFILLFGGSGSP